VRSSSPRETARPTATGDEIIDLYERHAADYARDRGRSRLERNWLDRFLTYVPTGGTVLDLGCGTGDPIARYLVSCGYKVVGVDSSPSMIAMCRDRFPESKWVVADMREVELDRRFDGILAWDSFFHLKREDQRPMFERFARHASPGAPLMFTSGPRDGEAIGSYHGEPLYHASLDPAECRELLQINGFVVRDFVPDDPECGGHTIWLATFDQDPARSTSR
jgi:SAM-dependent methyltransferase